MIRSIRERHPVAAALACAFLQFLVTVAILVAGRSVVPPDQFGKVKLVAFASTLLVPIALAQVLGLWRELGLQRVKVTPLFAASLLVCVPYLLLGLRVPPETSVTEVLTIQAVNAFAEELLFRGVIFALLIRLPLWRALLINALLFGAMHLLHGIMDGNWAAAGHQALMTILGGLIFATVRANTKSLWPPIMLHLLLNLSVIFSNGEAAEAAGTLEFANVSSHGVQVAIFAMLLWKTWQGRQSSSSPRYPQVSS